jgi:hypothetical protein
MREAGRFRQARLANDVAKQRLLAHHLDLEISDTVAIGVAFQKEGGTLGQDVQLAGLVMEGLMLDETEVLIA